MISGTSYECIERTILASAGYRRALVFMINRASRLLWTRPFQRKIDVTDGTKLAQAASFFETTASAMRPASRRFDVVINTTNTLRAEALMTDSPAFLSKSYALPRNIKDTGIKKSIS
jgi:Holliday junction resolvase-like predicted endonuclease